MRARDRVVILLRFLLLGLAALAATAGPASAASLPAVPSGHRPGPDVLYARPAVAPQLTSARPWRAPPILVSGASAYRRGEFLYQDFLYDDHGARGARDRGDPFFDDHTFSPRAGTFTYPRDRTYADNAADLVELRVKPLRDATAFRVTLNTLRDPERVAFTVALGESDAPQAWPHGAGVRSPAALFLTVHGRAAELRDAARGTVRAPAPSVRVDMRRRQFDVRVPRAAWDPGRRRVRMAAGVGLWDRGAGRYLAPRATATEAEPGGASPTGAALFNLAFRFDEPMPDVDAHGLGLTLFDAAVLAGVEAQWWRERAQADALRAGDVSRFHARVDFAQLAARARDESNVPRTGPLNRILASRFAFGQGVDHSESCFDITGGARLERPCEGRLRGRLQPYALYVPRKPRPPRGWGLTLLLHSLSANYNQYLDSRYARQLGERGAGTLVATPAGRGPDGFYADVAEADTFEVWADVARRYRLDPGWTTVTGYSMGGFGTYGLLARWPDLFARGASVVGAPGKVMPQLASLRHTPILAWAAVADELVPVDETEAAQERLAELGLRFESGLFETADHLTLATNDEYGPLAAFLGEHRVQRDPARVTYVLAPRHDYAPAGVVADHAYWLSGLRLREAREGRLGTMDARSHAFGRGTPAVRGVRTSQRVLEGGAHGPMPYRHREQRWRRPPPTPPADRLEVRADNIARATVDARRARLSCAPTLAAVADGPLDLTLTCPPPPRAAGCRAMLVLRLPRVTGARITRVTARAMGARVARVRGRELRRVALPRPTRGAFDLVVRARTDADRGLRSVTVVRPVRACR